MSNKNHHTQALTMNNTKNNTMQNTMHVEIWSDVLCPFCYIGKRRFEAALADFPQRKNITVTWKSFQLDPHAKAGEHPSYAQMLATKKGLHPQQAVQMLAGVTAMARESGLNYHFERAVVANSYDAHRFSHLALKHGLQDAAEEALFSAHFTSGKDIADRAILAALGTAIGLDANEVQRVLESNEYAAEVQADVREASEIGVQGVPFFVFNRRYAVSGAQESAVFLDVLTQSFAEWQLEQAPTELQTLNGQVCTPEGECV